MKRLVILFLPVFLSVLVRPAAAQTPIDLVYHAIPTVPTFDIPEEVSQVAGNLQSSVNQSKQIILQAKSDITNLQSAVMSTYENIKNGSIISISGASGQGSETFCGTPVNNVKTKKIAKKMKKLFLTYKSQKNKDVLAAAQTREKFYLESVYSIHQAVVELQNKLDNDISVSIEKAAACADGDGTLCGTPSSDEGGNNEVLFTYGKTLETFDSVVRLWENVAALKARLKALEVMMKITPALETSADSSSDTESSSDSAKETAFLPELPSGVVSLHNSEQLAFAQVTYKTAVTSLSNLEAEASGNTSEAMSLISQTVEFVSPDEADNEHPLIAAEDKLETLSSLTDVEQDVNEAMSVHNMLNSLKEYKKLADQIVDMRQDYQKSLQKLKDSEQCSLNYIGRYFSSPVKTWSGVSLGDNVNRHDLRKGISGWAVEAYETAKAAETSVVGSEDVAQVSVDATAKADLLDDPDMEKAKAKSQNTGITINTSKQEEAEEENRRSALLAWQIGAEAAKMLGSDSGEWGTPRGKSLVWNDIRNFYRQYLSRKYENVKSYLKSYTRDDVLALIIAKLRGQDVDITETNYQKQAREAILKASSDTVAAAASQAQYDSQSQTTLQSLQKQREALVAKMDATNDIISKNRNAIADMRSVAEDTAAQEVDETINAKVVFPAVGSTTVASASTSDKIIGADNLSAAITSAASVSIDEDKISSLENEAESNQKKLDSYTNELSELDAKIARAKQQAQSTAGQMRQQGAQTLQSIQNTLASVLQEKSSQYAADVEDNLREVLRPLIKEGSSLTLGTLVSRARQAAQTSLNNLYNQVDTIVDLHYNQILALGDNLYKPSSHARVAQIHKQMIEEIRALTLAYSAAGIISVNDIAVYAKLLDIDTSAETEGFFVGAAPKERDLKAPFAIPDFSSPPVREVFHFDASDYANIKPYVSDKENNTAVTAAEFLNFGGDIPLIWKYMLQENAFIESQFDLTEALTAGNSRYRFYRGGFMPCVVKDSSIIVDVDGSGNFVRREDGRVSASSLPSCYLMEMKNGRPYHKVQDVAVDFKMTTLGEEEREKILNDLFPENDYKAYVPPADDDNSSELGMFLRAEENNTLFFNTWAADVYNTMLKDNGDEELSDGEKNKFAAAYYASFSRNQIGDFLGHVENEKLQRENLEEYEQKYDEQMEALKEQLRSYGFEPSDSFDLSNDSDYKLATDKLNSIKKQILSAAESGLSGVDRTDNEPVEEKAGIFDKLIALMYKDEDALLKISMTTADSNDLDAELKEAEADAKLVDKYENSLNDQAQDYNDIQEPYCANY